MATKKTTENEATLDIKEKELEKAIEKLKKEKEALLKEVEAMKNVSEEPETKEPETDPNTDYWNELVPYEAFYDGDRYKDDISVMVNGKRWLIKRGVRVMLPRKVEHVLRNAERQRKYSADFNKRLQNNFERDTKRYLGE